VKESDAPGGVSRLQWDETAVSVGFGLMGPGRWHKPTRTTGEART